MNNLNQLSKRDIERLSAYLDQELGPKQSARLEARLKIDPGLRDALEQMRATSGLLRSLPEVRVPRNFTLSPEMAPASAGLSMFKIYRMATVVAAIALVVAVGVDFLGSGRMQMAAEAPARLEMAAEDSAPELAAEPMMEAAPLEEAGEPVMEAAEEPPVAGAMEAPKAYEEAEPSIEAEAAPVEAPRGTAALGSESEGQDNLIPDEETWEPSTVLPPILTATPTSMGGEIQEWEATPIPSIEEPPGWHGLLKDLSLMRMLEFAAAAALALFGALTVFTRRNR